MTAPSSPLGSYLAVYVHQVHQLLRLIAVPRHFILFIPEGQLERQRQRELRLFLERKLNQTDVLIEKTDIKIFPNPGTGPLLRTHGWTADIFYLNSAHDQAGIKLSRRRYFHLLFTDTAMTVAVISVICCSFKEELAQGRRRILLTAKVLSKQH